MSKLTAWASLLSLLGVGILIGGLAVHIHHSWDRDDERRRPPRPIGFAERLDAELDLSDDQRRAIEAVIERTHREGERLRRELRPQLLSHVVASHDEIRALLDDAQRARFDEIAPDPEKLGRDFFSSRARRGKAPWSKGRGKGKGPRGKRPLDSPSPPPLGADPDGQ